ncbi:MAG: DEAD/DEAH box helicase [Alphaproteobacteria bacterium]|nr:DEAD/DEAH box helicase [Alphaproteobacteria bacterium]
MTQFTDLGLAKPLLQALTAEGYTTPTPIQAQAIPGVLSGRDLLGIAQTGTGKTAAFALPILHLLSANPRPAPRRGCRALVLSPTRELAIQIADSFRTYGKHLGLRVATVFGGVKHGAQIKALSTGLDILVATPGRLIDHLQEKNAQLRDTEILVLDEADQMLDLGFLPPIRKIVSHMNAKRQNLFFSATMPADIAKLAGDLLHDPLKVSVAPQSTTAERVAQQILFVEAGRKRALLNELFADANFSRVLVFTRTKRGADRVARSLEQAGVEAAAIHGDKSQSQRQRALAAFKAGDVRALVATDIAARGIDVDAVTHVVQFDLPEVPEAYVHRIGRTARAGASGSAVAFCADDERDLLRAIQKVTRQTIPSTDRRNDQALGAATAAAPSLPAESRGERPARGQRHQPGRKPARPPHQKSHAPHRDGAPGASAKKHRGGKGGRNNQGKRTDSKPQSGNGERRYVAATTPWSPVK